MEEGMIFEDAVASVKDRGFYDSDNPANSWGLIMGQVLRLVEEVGEVARALRKRQTEQILIEIADVVIVCANLFHVVAQETNCPYSLEQVILDKLAADEARGRLHAGHPGSGGSH
jgi:phosphoribosyl-ATP pyrophosphohydrolase